MSEQRERHFADALQSVCAEAALAKTKKPMAVHNVRGA
jgi:hypothetical protein